MQYIDPYTLLIIAMIISFYAQIKVQSTFKRYSSVRCNKGYTAAQVARYLLDRSGLNDVKIEPVAGNLTDHYDPRDKTLRLSQSVYNSNSVAAVGVAAHETGHAIQHDTGYAPLSIRTSLVPVVNFGSNASWLLIILALITGIQPLLNLGIVLFSAAVLFQLITLPVEFNASNRALGLLESEGILYNDEMDSARKVLSAAAFTYVAAAIVSIVQLIRLLSMSRRRSD